MELPKKSFKKAIAFTMAIGAFAVGASIPTEAANLTSTSLTLSNSAPSATSVGYNVGFTESSTTDVACIRVTFGTDTTFSTTPTGLGVSGAGGSVDVNGTNDAAFDTVTPQTASAPHYVDITRGTGKTDFGGNDVVAKFTGITNPSTAATYYARVQTFDDNACSNLVDNAIIAFAIVDGTVVSVTVDPTLSVEVTGMTGAAGNGQDFKAFPSGPGLGTVSTDSNCTASASAVTFPEGMNPDTNYFCGQKVRVGTNASDGYTATIKKISGSGSNFLYSSVAEIADIAGTNDGTDTNLADFPLSASTAFGYTSTDVLLGDGDTDRFDATNSAEWAAVTTTARPFAYSATPVSDNDTFLVYGLRFQASTPAASYSGTSSYVVTPVF